MKEREKWKGERWGSEWIRGEEGCPGPTRGMYITTDFCCIFYSKSAFPLDALTGEVERDVITLTITDEKYSTSTPCCTVRHHLVVTDHSGMWTRKTVVEVATCWRRVKQMGGPSWLSHALGINDDVDAWCHYCVWFSLTICAQNNNRVYERLFIFSNLLQTSLDRSLHCIKVRHFAI